MPYGGEVENSLSCLLWKPKMHPVAPGSRGMRKPFATPICGNDGACQTTPISAGRAASTGTQHSASERTGPLPVF